MNCCHMAYCWFPTRKNTSASLSIFSFWRPLDSKLAHSPSLLSYSIVYDSHCPPVRADANGN